MGNCANLFLNFLRRERRENKGDYSWSRVGSVIICKTVLSFSSFPKCCSGVRLQKAKRHSMHFRFPTIFLRFPGKREPKKSKNIFSPSLSNFKREKVHVNVQLVPLSSLPVLLTHICSCCKGNFFAELPKIWFLATLANTCSKHNPLLFGWHC